MAQLDEIAALNVELAPFRILTGIEVDINEDGSLDQSPEVLDRLDVVVGSVHSELRMPERPMTRRMVTALADPNLDVLGHCTGRMKAGRRNRPPSTFDAEIVFAAAARFDKAIEVNSRPERLDPPKRLLRLAVEAGCRVSIDSDAHTLGQLSWLRNGCERAFLCGVTSDMVVNALAADDLLAWTDFAPRIGGWRETCIGQGRAHTFGAHQDWRNPMPVARVTELSCTSTDSFEDAVRQGIDRATKTLRGVRGAWVKEQRVNVGRDGAIEFQANILVTFVLED